MGEFPRKLEREIESFRYPVPPAQYEPLLERMVATQELAIPFFFHEHHYLVDKRRRAALFSTLYTEMVDKASKGDVVLQLTDSERTSIMFSHAWVTNETLRKYLNLYGVAPWWEQEENLVTHSRLERVLLSDGLSQATTDPTEEYDSQQLPSYLFGQMLLQRARIRLSGTRAREVVGSASAVEPRPIAVEVPKFHSTSQSRTVSSVETATTGDESAPKITKALPLANHDKARVLDEIRSEIAFEEARPKWRSELPILLAQAPTAPADLDEVMLTKRQVAELLGVSVNTVDNRRSDDPYFPQAVVYGQRSLRWKRSEIRQWRDRKKTR
ncbi:hypothetical protein GCM10027214_05760 [Stenotrophomonas tumulicola]